MRAFFAGQQETTSSELNRSRRRGGISCSVNAERILAALGHFLKLAADKSEAEEKLQEVKRRATIDNATVPV